MWEIAESCQNGNEMYLDVFCDQFTMQWQSRHARDDEN